MPISPQNRARFFDLLERAGWTAGQQFAAVLLANSAAGSVVDIPWEFALSTAAGAAIVSAVATLGQYFTSLSDTRYWVDLGIRLVKTFIASMLGSFGADVLNVLEFDWSSAFDLAVLATLGALAKGLLAREPTPAPSPPAILPDPNDPNPAALPSDPPGPSPSTMPIEVYRLAVAR